MKKADVIVVIIIFYVIVAIGYTIITGVGTFVADLIDGPTHYYLLYSWKNTEVAKKFQKKICTRNRRISSNKRSSRYNC